MKENYRIPKVTPVYDEQGNVKYYEDDEYFYVEKKGEFINNL